MNFKIKNFGKIVEAEIKFNGITVICGNNNTGKSTVGKALFGFFNSLYDHKAKISAQKYSVFRDFVYMNTKSPMGMPSRLLNSKPISFISNHSGPYTLNEVKEYLESRFTIKVDKEKLPSLIDLLNLPEMDILNLYIFRFFNSIMNDQIKNVNAGKERCFIAAKFRDSESTISFTSKKSALELGEPIAHSAYFINNPFVLDYLNERSFLVNSMDNSVINAIYRTQSDLVDDSMTNILDSVRNKKDLDIVRDIIKKAYKGDTKRDRGQYFYYENGNNIDFRNISAGLKSFALIEMLLETGVIKRKDVLILDEPEIHLHSEWQIIYAELIVVLQKVFDLTILLVTHSFQFLESLNYFMKYYKILDRGNYYMSKETEKGFIIQDCTENIETIKNNLSTGTFKIADMEFKYDMENGNEHSED